MEYKLSIVILIFLAKNKHEYYDSDGGNQMLGESITKLRKRRGLTQKALADAIHVTQSAVSQWENNRTSPDCQQMFILSDFFGVTVDDLRDEKVEYEQSAPKQQKSESISEREQERAILDTLDAEQLRQVLEYARFLKMQAKQE